MLRQVLISKISTATVTDKKLYYEGSITIDENILKQAKIHVNEKVEVLNLNNGARIETYVIKGAPGSGQVCLNGPAARFFEIKDRVIIVCYGLIEENGLDSHQTIFVNLDEKNKVKNTYLR